MTVERTVLSCRPICVSGFRSCSLFMIIIRCRSTSMPISCWFRLLLVKAIIRMKTNTEIRNMIRKHIIGRKISSIIPVLFRAFFKSFSDAPGGFKEELREIYFSTGLEYSYNRRFFVRAGIIMRINTREIASMRLSVRVFL